MDSFSSRKPPKFDTPPDFERVLAMNIDLDVDANAVAQLNSSNSSFGSDNSASFQSPLQQSFALSKLLRTGCINLATNPIMNRVLALNSVAFVGSQLANIWSPIVRNCYEPSGAADSPPVRTK